MLYIDGLTHTRAHAREVGGILRKNVDSKNQRKEEAKQQR